MARSFLGLVGLGLLCALPACYSVDHFAGDASRYDGLYFGAAAEAPLEPQLADSKWRNYALFGLVPWSEDHERWAGERLAQAGADARPLRVTVHTEQSILNGLTSFVLGTLTGVLGPLIFVPRSTEVQAWSPGG